MKKTIAVIDDDPVLREMVSMVLQEEGYTVNTYSHTVFIDVLESEDYDLLLLDIWFGASRAGIEMAQAVRNRSALQKKPIILMSSDAHLEEYAVKAGVKNYLQKPLNFEALLEVVANLTQKNKIMPFSQETVAYNQIP